MKLFLAAEAKTNIPTINDFVGGFKNKKLAYIPTAANGLVRESWKKGETWALVQNLEVNLESIELENYHTSGSVSDDLKDKDIIWFAGGMGGYLLYWIHRTKLINSIKAILNNGSIYIGSSSGAMITAKDQSVSEWFIGETEPGSSYIPGLDLVDFNIYPHYEDYMLPEIKEQYTGSKMYLLKNGEAVTVDGDTVSVLGEERIVYGK